MYTVRGQLAHVWCTESASQIQSQVQVVAEIANGSHATCNTIKVATEICEAPFAILLQSIAVQSAVVIAHTSIKRPAVAKCLGGSSIYAKVEQSVVGYQVLLALVARLLIHTAYAGRQLPSVKLIGDVSQVVGKGVQLEVQFVLVHILLELLSTVLLVADDGLEVSVVKIKRVVPNQFVVLYLLEWERLAVGLNIAGVTN